MRLSISVLLHFWEVWGSLELETFLKFNLHFRCPSAPSRLGVPFHNSNFGPAGVGRKIQPPRWRAATLRNFSSSTGNTRLSLTLILSLSCIRSWRLNLVNCELRVFSKLRWRLALCDSGWCLETTGSHRSDHSVFGSHWSQQHQCCCCCCRCTL